MSGSVLGYGTSDLLGADPAVQGYAPPGLEHAGSTSDATSARAHRSFTPLDGERNKWVSYYKPFVEPQSDIYKPQTGTSVLLGFLISMLHR